MKTKQTNVLTWAKGLFQTKKAAWSNQLLHKWDLINKKRHKARAYRKQALQMAVQEVGY